MLTEQWKWTHLISPEGDFVIELVSSEYDDVGFLQFAQRIVNGAITALRVHEVYLVHVDNWFDHKWLGWWSSWEYKELKELCVPPFNPNRVRSQECDKASGIATIRIIRCGRACLARTA